MDEEQRVISGSCRKKRIYALISGICLASISMTLCEIATGNHYSIPLECRPFYTAGSVPLQPPYPSVGADVASQCVE